ncbi:ead/Ea22-like family protein [Azotobacter beijerinckii]|uniref:ead/Ea22-like family protein n=1 Tax=Azotobacter beijerinckii TaxID=170623 RepID=UPI002954C152|nr:ead/Ea22-like family protein [Azotobacter beijerinckii]MDV7209933.1 ead/Ea22-like family protein [Azotobacter beijerinckii]
MVDWSELNRLAEAATPGPWRIGKANRDESDIGIHGAGDGSIVADVCSDVWGDADANAEFIAAANPAAILALIAENERLKQELSGPHDVFAKDLVKELVDNAQAILENSDDGEDEFYIVLMASAERLRRQEAKLDQLRAELERVRAEGEALRKHLAECADSLESEILDRYGSSKDHPAMRRKFELDMQDVNEARALLGNSGGAENALKTAETTEIDGSEGGAE